MGSDEDNGRAYVTDRGLSDEDKDMESEDEDEDEGYGYGM